MASDSQVADPATGARTTRAALVTLIGPRRWQMAALAFSSLVGGLSEAAFLILVTRTALAISKRDQSFAVWHGLKLGVTPALWLGLGLVVVRVGAGVLAGAQMARLGAEVVGDTRRDLAAAFLRAAWPVQQQERGGQLQELLTTFTLQGSILINSITTSVNSAFYLVALLGFAIAIGPEQALGVIVGVGLLSIVLRPLRNVVRRRGNHSAEVGMRFATSLNEVSELGMEVHVFHVQEQAEGRVLALIDQTEDADRRLTFSRTLIPPLYTAAAFLALVAALAILAHANNLSLDSLGPILLVMLRSLTYGQALQATSAQVAASIPYVHALQERLRVYQDGEQRDDGVPVERVDDLELRDVTFSYVPGKPVLKGIDATIPKREVVGIVGPSGGGKSTLVQLLLGLRRPDSGAVLADGRPVETLSRADWARRVTFVPQAAHLIAGSVADNIRFLREGITDEEIVRAAELAQLSRDVAGFAEGYDREVGSRGGQLSGGQQQRLCIARALIEKPDILILDEPTASLDMLSEQLIRESLLELAKEMTIIIIAHRLSTLDICHRIMVIQEGELRGFDTPAVLNESNAFFREALMLSGMTAPGAR
jgi:ABC-type multidrug transport system fused ATPase/permease subunit